LPRNKEDVLVGIAQLDDRVSLYTAWGDWLGLTCLAIAIGLVPMGLARRLLDQRRGSRKTGPA
jgi:apolipoprotein N-acyltransferase